MMYTLYKDDYNVNSESLVMEMAGIEDAREVLALQKLAYRSEAEIINDFTIQPLTESEDEIVEEFKTRTVFKISTVNNKNGNRQNKSAKMIIASVRGYKESNSCYIGRLIVHPQYRNMGIGSELLGIIESHFSGASRYELFTGEKSAKNIRMYERAGYRPFKVERVNDNLNLVFMEKKNCG